MTTYAADTKVPASRSRSEIETTLSRYGASAFAYLSAHNGAMIEFAANKRRIRFMVEIPEEGASMFARTPTGRTRSKEQARAAREQLIRQR